MYDNSDMGGDVDYTTFIRHIESLGFLFIGQGCFRQVFKRGKIVIKVPRNVDGVYDNRTEAAAWHKYKSNPTSKGYRLAPCRMLPNGCQMMVAVNMHYDPDVLYHETWTHKIENSQVGMYRDKTVAYDYALNIVERSEWEKEWGIRSVWFYANGLNNADFQ